MSDKPLVSGEEVAKHTTRETGVWVIVHGKVYDVTEWLDEHPGGSKIILKYAGKDATEEFEPIHPPGVIGDNLPEDKYIGPLDPNSVKETVHITAEKEQAGGEGESKQKPDLDASSSQAQQQKDSGNSKNQIVKAEPTITQPADRDLLPDLAEVLSLHDFEHLANQIMSRKGWAYYSSGADDEITMRENTLAFQRIWFRPRVLRNVKTVDYSTTLLGAKTSMPIYITGTALGKLGHKEGEVLLTRAAGKHDVIQMIPTLASCSLDEMLDAAVPGQTQWLQLYVNANRSLTQKIIEKAETRGVKALFITVDAPQLGRREKDMRMKFDDPGSKVQEKNVVERGQGAARAISSFIDSSLSWEDLAWFKTVTKLPILLKGVQCYEDVLLAIKAGMQGVVLSNHGGRQLEFARSGIEVLVEVVSELKKRKMWPVPNFEIMIDGGVRRASDVLKAVALGATAVGIGRPFLYAMSTYGQEGVEQAMQILKDEFEMNLRLIGAPKLSDIGPEMVDAKSVGLHVTMPGESAYMQNYERLTGATLRANL